MIKGISLTASMRSNLLSLSNISTQMSKIQNILSTGKKVNSAIDNASSYYQARSLTNRASDLNSLLDSMSQGIQTIQAATQGLENATSYLMQAKAVAEEICVDDIIPEKDWFEKQDGVVAVVTTYNELLNAINSDKKGDIVIYGEIDCKDTITLKQGQCLVGIGKYGFNQPNKDKFSQLTFNDVAQYGIKAQANNITLSDLSIKFTAEKTNAFAIYGKSNVEYNMHNIDVLLENKNDIQVNGCTLGIINMTGTNSIYQNGDQGASYSITNAFKHVTCNLTGKLDINMVSPNSIASSYSTINTYDNTEINVSAIRQAFQACNLSLNDNTKINIKSDLVFSTSSIVDVNDNTELNATTKVFLYVTNDTFNINSISSKINVNTGSMFLKGCNLTMKQGCTYAHNGKLYFANKDINSKIDTGIPDGISKVEGITVDLPKTLDWLLEEDKNRKLSYIYGSNEDERYNEYKQYSQILTQFDNLMSDASYQGVNLLTGGNLEVTFNESRTHGLTVKGKDMRSDNIGIKTKKWTSKTDIKSALKEIDNAINTVRLYNAELGNNYTIIQTRQNFTEALSDILEVGADKLTLADMNETSAEYLMLQTRQQLAVNSLSLASQSAKSILSLF